MIKRLPHVRIYVKHLQQQNIVTSRFSTSRSTWSSLCKKNANENHPKSNNAFIPSFDAKLLKQSISNGPKHSFLTKKTNITWCLSAILKTEIICCLHRNTHTITVNSCIKS